MTIKNNTTVSLEILGGTLEPEQIRDYPEKCFNELKIKSEIGSCKIITEYSQRKIRNYGKLVAKESKKQDEDGMKEIIVSAIS